MAERPVMMTAHLSTIPLRRVPAGLGVIALILSHAGAPVLATDISYYGVTKGILFTQTNAGSPVIRSELPYAFQAVVMPPTNLVTSARVQWSLADLALTAITTPNALGFVQRVRNQDLLDATFPNGVYRIATQTVNDGGRTSSLTLSGNDYPAAPVVRNYTNAQAIDAELPFSLTWNGFAGGTTNDFIVVQIENSFGRVFATGMHPGASGALNGTDTSTLIPAHTLQPGRAYAARIAFHRFSDFNSTDYPGVTGSGGYFTQTDFYMTTTGSGDSTPPTVLMASPTNGSSGVPINAPVVFHFNETMNRGFSFGLSGTTARRTFEWSPDSQVLVVTPVTNWPPNTTIVWTLNLFYTLLAFGDTSANPLPMETVLTFTTGSNVESNRPPVLSDQKRLPNGRFQFLVSGESNRSYTIQASTNLLQWVSLTTNVAFSGQIEFLDPAAPALPRRFYRAFGQ